MATICWQILSYYLVDLLLPSQHCLRCDRVLGETLTRKGRLPEIVKRKNYERH